MLKVPYRLMFPAIVLFCCVGAFAINNSVVDVYVMLVCGVLGYFFIKVGVETAPLLLGMVLGPMLEENLRRAMMISGGDFSVFVTRPISAVLLGVAALLIVILVSPKFGRVRQEQL